MSLTKIASRAFADQEALFLQEMRASKSRYGFEKAALTLSEWNGRSHEEMRSHGLRVVSDYVRLSFNDAYEALDWLYKEQERLAIWCSCACARKLLPFAAKDDSVSLATIETTEGWVLGKTNKDQVRIASRKSYDLAIQVNMLEADVPMAASYASASGFAANVTITVAAALSIKLESDYDAELRRLIEVIADAVLTFPLKTKKLASSSRG